MQVGFIGLDNMGSAMAANLLAAGHALTVYNRTPAKADILVAKGSRLAKTPADAAQGEIVITMLADDHAIEQVVFGEHGILEALAPGAIHLSMSTISTTLADRLDNAHREKRTRACAVFERPDAAAAAKLFIVPAARPEAVATFVPLFQAIGQRNFVVASGRLWRTSSKSPAVFPSRR
jgi:3-hydroxyisobutyrate dehydrogenase-like beta-hydroxyacid dehydrogenase